MGYWIIDGKQMSDEEYEEHCRTKKEAEEQVRRQAAALVELLGKTYEALTGLMQQHPEVGRQVSGKEAVDEEIYQKLRRSLERADESPRCRWIKQGGTMCGSPQMRKHIYCYAHKQMMEARALALRLPALEDGNAIQVALMRVQKALIDDTITVKKAGLLLYSLQLAVTNIANTTFGEAEDQEMVTDAVDEIEALSNQPSAIGQEGFTAEGAKPPHQTNGGFGGGSGDAKNAQEGKGFTAEDAEHAEDPKEDRGLPWISMDRRVLEGGPGAILPQSAGVGGGNGDAHVA